MEYKEFRVKILMKEMDICSTKVNHFDLLRLRTRQVGIALWIAAVGFGLKENIQSLFLLAVFLPFPFWFYEASCRRYQRGWNLRLRAVRDFIRDGKYLVIGKHEATLQDFLSNDNMPVFPTIDFWARRTVSEEKHRKETSLRNSFLYLYVVIIYAPMVMIALALAKWHNVVL